MDPSIRNLILGSSAAIFASSLFSGCSNHKPNQAEAQPAAIEQAAPAKPATDLEALAQEKPGAAEGELFVLEAVVKAIDKKNRIVTLLHSDGKISKVKCGPEVRNFPQIRVGDNVTAEFLVTVELFVADTQGTPGKTTAKAMERAPKGSKPGMVAVQQAEITATVQSINYETRQVILKGPQGKTLKVTAGPEVKRLNEIKQGDSVVARYTEAFSIKVSSPKKK